MEPTEVGGRACSPVVWFWRLHAPGLGAGRLYASQRVAVRSDCGRLQPTSNGLGTHGVVGLEYSMQCLDLRSSCVDWS
jgi:hypothetical protein